MPLNIEDISILITVIQIMMNRRHKNIFVSLSSCRSLFCIRPSSIFAWSSTPAIFLPIFPLHEKIGESTSSCRRSHASPISTIFPPNKLFIIALLYEYQNTHTFVSPLFLLAHPVFLKFSST